MMNRVDLSVNCHKRIILEALFKQVLLYVFFVLKRFESFQNRIITINSVLSWKLITL